MLYSFVIYYLGCKVFKIIVVEIKYVLDLWEWIIEDFINIKDIGLVVVENIVYYFYDEYNIKMLEEMEVFGVNL